MRKLISLLLPGAIMASLAFAGTACTVKVQAKEEPPPRVEPKPEPPPPPPKPKRKKRVLKLDFSNMKKKGWELDMPEPVPFKTGSAELDLDEGAEEILDLVVQHMAKNPDVTLLRVEGHTDSDGDDAANMQLSKDRAAAVTAWLVTKGVACARLLPVGFGEERPVGPNDTTENKAKNRRVAFFEASIKNKPVFDVGTKKTIPVDNGGKVAVDPCNPAVKK